jgi:dipeptidyl aminopeptidase/acylaminoacyl peptidase
MPHAGSARAATPGFNGFLAWQRAPTSNSNESQIYVNGVDITPAGVQDTYPKWSPDGTKILFMSSTALPGLQPGLWVMNADGSNRQLIKTGTFNCSGSTICAWYPDWSPDGTKIAYVCNTGALGTICVTNADGTQQKIVYNGNFADAPTWSPDGTRILFTACLNGCKSGATNDLWSVLTTGGGLTQITNTSNANEYYSSWSPDGTKIVYDGGASGGIEAIYVANPGSPVILYQATPPFQVFGDPVWSPDGTKIAFIVYDANGTGGFQTDIIEMSADGSNAVDVSNTFGYNETFVAWQPLGNLCSHNKGGLQCGPAYTTAVLASSSSPTAVRVAQGQTVRWITDLLAGRSHSIADASGLGLFDSGSLRPGASYNFTFQAAGTYPVVDSTTARISWVRVRPPAQQVQPSRLPGPPLRRQSGALITWRSCFLVRLPGRHGRHTCTSPERRSLRKRGRAPISFGPNFVRQAVPLTRSGRHHSR